MRRTRVGLVWDARDSKAVPKRGSLYSESHPKGIGIYALEIGGKKYNAGNVVLRDVGVGWNASQFEREILGKSRTVEIDRDFDDWGDFAAYVNFKLDRKRADAQMSPFDIAYLNGLDIRTERPPSSGSTIVAMGPKTVIGGPSGVVEAYNVDMLRVPDDAIPIMFNPSMSNQMFDARTQDIHDVFVGADRVYMTSSEPGGGPNFGVWAVNPRFRRADDVEGFLSTREQLAERHGAAVKIIRRDKKKP